MSDTAEEVVEPEATPAEGEAGTTEETTGAEPKHTDEEEVGEKGESSTTDDTSGEPDDVAKAKEGTPPGYQKRIDKISGDKARLAEDNAYLRGKLDAQEAAVKPPKEEATGLVRPNIEDFDTQEDYSEALMDYKVEVRLEERDKVNAEKAKVTEAKTAKEKAQESFAEQISKARAKYNDFNEVVMNNNDIAITKSMIDVMQESTLGAEVAYHLGKNPDEALRIAKLTPTAQAMAIGRIEGILDAPEKQTTEPQRVTKASTPIGKGVQGKGGTLKKSYNQMSASEYAHARNLEEGLIGG